MEVELDPQANTTALDLTIDNIRLLGGDEPLLCRVTGGINDTTGLYDSTLLPQDRAEGNRYTAGGQAGASTASQPQPKGEWTHHQQSGEAGSFVFHGGTASAPLGTEIEEIRCSDEGFCFPARPAPAKQIDFDGIGTFKNLKLKPGSSLIGANLTAEGKGNQEFDGTFHRFEVNIDDLGEPGNENTKKNPLLGTGACPADGFGEKGSIDLANCGCPDFYRITIYDGIHAADAKNSGGSLKSWEDLKALDGEVVIYQVWGYIDGGNLQIHPPVGGGGN